MGMDNAYKTYIISWHTVTCNRPVGYVVRAGYTVVTARDKRSARRELRGRLSLYTGESLRIDRVDAR